MSKERPTHVERIASALCKDDYTTCARMIRPPWLETVDEQDDIVREAWAEVREVRRQRDGLIELKPDNRARYEKECDEIIMGLAAALKPRLSP